MVKGKTKERYLRETAGDRLEMAQRIHTATPVLGIEMSQEIAERVDEFALKPFHGTSEELTELKSICIV